MSQKIVVGPINKGLRTDVLPFNIDNDSFPTLINAYQWRGRVKRRRGTSQLGRLQRTLTSVALGNTNGSGAFSGNLISLASIPETNASIVPSSVTITVGAQTFTDNGAGVLSNGASGTGTINYATGAITFQTAPVLATTASTAVFTYYPSLPVMGLEDLVLDPTQETRNLGFDTTYAYNIPISYPYTPYSVSFYKNLATGTYSGYTQKTNATALTWNGQDYQQFWTCNYQGALWATNGIEEPFDITNVGMQYKPIVTVTVTSGTTATLQITSHGLVVGDFVFVNEVVTTTGINFQTGYVTTVTDANNVVVTFPNAALATNGTGGIAQYLTSRSDTTKDCIRWYDGDPTTGSAPYSPTPGKGWVNFCPPLSQASFSISDLPAGQYYLVGARMIIPFKDRLLFLGPVVQTSAAGSQAYLADTIIYSQNGTPYYTASFTGTPSATTSYTAILVPTGQTAQATSFWEDQTGFGGFIQAGIESPITTAGINEDVLIVGFKSRQTRLIYTGNDIIPFNFYSINTELGSESTFSSISLDRGVVTVGGRGIVITSQTSSQRIDAAIPDQIFQFNLKNNGSQRVCAQRDYINEWMYFTYRSNESSALYPNQTLFYNYRDSSWAIFDETYTTYGTFRKSTGLTWATIGTKYASWSVWNDPWDSGEANLLQPEVIGGNAQGFIMFLADGTNEGNSGYIKSFSTSTITSPGHGLNNGDYILISGCTGAVSSQVNGNIFSVSAVTQDTFTLNPPITSAAYTGLGVFKRMYVPYIQTKQFPLGWSMSRKTRLGIQQYLLTKTAGAQITLLIFLSENTANPYNFPPGSNDGLVYTSVLYTCPESTNLGLTTANINLQSPIATQQAQIWHRMNTSLLGDTVQIGFTLSDDQMRSLIVNSTPVNITGSTRASPCVLTCTSTFSPGDLITITGVSGMDQLNGNNYEVLSVTASTVTINVDSRQFDAYVSGGTASTIAPVNQFAEIELHSMILDVSPSGLLA